MNNKKYLSIGFKILSAFIGLIIMNLVILLFVGFNLRGIKNELLIMTGVEFLVEADRDAYQSNIALSFILNPKISSNLECVNNEIISCQENMEQVDMRFKKFEKAYNKTGANESFDYFYQYYETWKENTIKLQELIKSNDFVSAGNFYFSSYQTSFNDVRNSMDNIMESNSTQEDRINEHAEINSSKQNKRINEFKPDETITHENDDTAAFY